MRVLDMPDLSDKPVQVGADGQISLPAIGRVRAAGLTTSAIEAELRTRLKDELLDPRVSVSLTEMRSRPVSVLGAVNRPGVYQLDGPRTLVELISIAGGLRPDAGYTVRISRPAENGPLPLRTAARDASGRFHVGEASVNRVIEARDPEENILILPRDVVTVTTAEIVYVVGEVNRAGGFPVKEQESMSVLQALALAGGATRQAASGKARLLRSRNGSSQREEIPINLRKVSAGRAEDVTMRPGDILLVPGSLAKGAGTRAGETALSILTGIIVWGRY